MTTKDFDEIVKRVVDEFKTEELVLDHEDNYYIKGTTKDLESAVRVALTQHHEAEVAETYKQAQKDFFSMDLIASFLDFVPDEHKDIARQSYIDAVARQVKKFYTPTKTDKTIGV